MLNLEGLSIPSVGLFSDNITISELYTIVQKKKTRKRTSNGVAKKTTVGRHIRWNPDTPPYVCIKNSETNFANESEIDVAFKEGTLSTKHFYIFKNKDPQVVRNQNVPLYEAVYKCGSHFVMVQKCHLKQAYCNNGQTNCEHMWDILEDGTPYWVDRYAVCKKNQQISKQKYEKKIKLK